MSDLRARSQALAARTAIGIGLRPPHIGELLGARGLKVTRLARGVPVGGELEYVDSGTLAQAVIERRTLEATP